MERGFSITEDIITKKRNRLSGKTISNIMQYKRWRAHHGECIIIIDSEKIFEEYNKDDIDMENEFEERNMEFEEWLIEWMKKKEAARGLFRDEM